MISGRSRVCGGILIFADESAEWRCGGLRQIDRLLLALNESIGADEVTDVIPLCISGLQISEQSLPQHSRLARLTISDDIEQFSRKTEHSAPAGSVLVVSTRLVICRRAAAPVANRVLFDEHAPIILV